MQYILKYMHTTAMLRQLISSYALAISTRSMPCTAEQAVDEGSMVSRPCASQAGSMQVIMCKLCCNRASISNDANHNDAATLSVRYLRHIDCNECHAKGSRSHRSCFWRKRLYRHRAGETATRERLQRQRNRQVYIQYREN